MIIEPEDIRRIRLNLGITQRKLARLAGVSQSFIAKIENGQVDPSYSKLKAISEALVNLMRSSGRASDIMTSPVISVEPDDRVERAVELFEKHGISQVPVLQGGKVIGNFTERDLVRIVSSDPEGFLKRRIGDVMSDPPPIVGENTSVNLVLSMLDKFQSLIVSRKGEVVGIITRADVMKIRRTSRTSRGHR